jgi:transcriptional regulator PpsR
VPVVPQARVRPMTRRSPPTAARGRPADGAQRLDPRLERVLLAASDWVVLLGADARVAAVRCRDAALGERLARAWNGRLFIDTVTVESRPKVIQLLSGGEQDAVTVPRHVNQVLEDGLELPVQYGATPLPADEAAGGPGWLLTARDLRDTMNVQRRLVEAQQTMERDHWRFREAETRYRSLFQSSVEAILVAEGAGLRIAEANPAAQAMLDGARGRKARLVGSALAGLFAPEAAEPLAAAAASARSIGRHDRIHLRLAGGEAPVAVSMASFQQDGTSYLLVRLLPEGESAPDAASARRNPQRDKPRLPALESAEAAYVRGASDALCFTDAAGRIVSANRAFVRLAQLTAQAAALGEPLDRWLGRSGVELQVLLANLREGGSPGLLATEMRGELGLVTAVEVSACTLESAAPAAFAFSLRDVGRRLAPGEQSLPRVPASVRQLSELVGRVPLKQIVSETSDLIEKLSIEAALQMTRDNRALAAQMLGLSRQSLYVKLRRFGLGGLGAGDAEEP